MYVLPVEKHDPNGVRWIDPVTETVSFTGWCNSCQYRGAVIIDGSDPAPAEARWHQDHATFVGRQVAREEGRRMRRRLQHRIIRLTRLIGGRRV